MIYKVLWCNMLPFNPGTLGATPFLDDKCSGFFQVLYTTHRSYDFKSHLKNAATTVKCLAFQRTQVSRLGLKPTLC